MKAPRYRRAERETLERLLADVRAGRSRTLVVRGEPGIGKTALLDHLAGHTSGCQVTRAAGVQAERELSFAGLHQLCLPLLGGLDRLPDPQREALGTVFGLSAGRRPDPFLVGLAVLGLFADAAGESPLVCLVDDVQWLDHASARTLAFVARRLLAESVALVFATRETAEGAGLAGLAELPVEGLPPAQARALLLSALRAPVDERVVDQIVAETGGNPLALLELPKAMSPAELAGGFGLPGRTLPSRIEESFQRRLGALGARTRRLLLVAAADPLGDPVLLWRAAGRLGLGMDEAEPAVADGLVEFGARVRFRHPLVRSAVYRGASAAHRRRAHAALAQATDPAADPDRLAWHRAQAVAWPDEAVAAALERGAARARARGGLAAAAAFLERAVELTEVPEDRSRRALAAARTALDAGAPDTASGLLAVAQSGHLDELHHARVDLLRAQIAFSVRKSGDAPGLLLKAAHRLESLDTALARETCLEALDAALFAGPLANGVGVREAAQAALDAPPAPSSRPVDLLLDGLAVRFTEGFAEGSAPLRRALDSFRAHGGEDDLRWFWLFCRVARDLWRFETWDELSATHIRVARDTGALTVLPFALSSRLLIHLFAGELTEAAALQDEVEAVTEAAGTQLAPYGAMLLAAWRGDREETGRLAGRAREEALSRGEGIALSTAWWASALVDNARGHYSEALAGAERASEPPEESWFSTWASVELIEAATRCGTPERAEESFRWLTAATQAGGTEWGLGIQARSRALLSRGTAAEEAYREAIERLGRTRVRSELARAHLVYGEWLRRESRRLDAREQLRRAHELFAAMGMAGFADRAARELRATGAAARQHPGEPGTALTAQEAQVVRLVREGLSNAEIGARLFISPRTVEWHLSRIFGKLGVRSRRQLGSS
ncbi:LuxR family transcriptional regulator [Prauserella flavalba]|uniref:LuxR family transcriptional regulator n=2 Tax=Prauserella flavalba TaxID=1477506 RepID=A0A318LPB6_9PSEU|nr:LuxR family transcriptional regulator [Prauserella flavalba]PXY36406.1 LuxR family transcriptional regulator [Prauserella flavalba]